MLFITDCEDNGQQATDAASLILKRKLASKEIVAKFSVIGVGDHRADMMSSFINMGSAPGQYTYADSSSNQPARILEGIKIFEQEVKIEPGVYVNVPGIANKVFVPVTSVDKDGTIKCEVKSVVVEAPNI